MTMQRLLSDLFTGAHQLGIRGTFQFVFSHDAAFSVRIHDDEAVTPGLAEKPDVVVRISEAAFSAVVAGAANVEQLFSDGRLQLEGDIGLATRLPEVVARARGCKPTTATQGEGRYPARARYSEVLSSRQRSE